MDLLLVEDNPTDRMVIQARLRHAFPSAEILAADDPIGMNEHLKRDGCDIVITDYWLGWSDGLSILQRVRERWPRSRVIMLTGNGGEEVMARAFKHGLYHYLLKPRRVRGACGGDRGRDGEQAARRFQRADDDDRQFDSRRRSSVDAAGRITATNAAALQMYGYAEIEIVGLANEVLLPVGRRDEIRPMHRAGARRGNRAAVPDPASPQRRHRNTGLDDDTADAPRRRSDFQRGVYRNRDWQDNSRRRDCEHAR